MADRGSWITRSAASLYITAAVPVLPCKSSYTRRSFLLLSFLVFAGVSIAFFKALFLSRVLRQFARTTPTFTYGMARLTTAEVLDLLDDDFPEPIMQDSDDDLGLQLSDDEEQ